MIRLHAQQSHGAIDQIVVFANTGAVLIVATVIKLAMVAIVPYLANDKVTVVVFPINGRTRR